MTRKKKLAILSLALVSGLAASGCVDFDSGSSSGGGNEDTDQAPESPDNGGNGGANNFANNVFTVIQDDVASIEVVGMAVQAQDSGTQLAVQEPLDLNPGTDAGFIVSWELDTSGVMISNEMLRLVFPNGDTVSIFGWAANPVDGALQSEMPCIYGNDHVMTCDWPGVPLSTGHRSDTQLSAFIQELPVTVRLESEHCSAIYGCVEGELGQLRLH